MDKNELRQMLQQREKMFEQRKLKRTIYTILFYTAVYLLIFYWQGQLNISSILDILGAVVVCTVLASITFFFNAVIFGQLVKLGKDEDEALQYIRKRLEKMEKEE